MNIATHNAYELYMYMPYFLWGPVQWFQSYDPFIELL